LAAAIVAEWERKPSGSPTYGTVGVRGGSIGPGLLRYLSAFNTPGFLLLIALHKEPPGTIEEA